MSTDTITWRLGLLVVILITKAVWITLPGLTICVLFWVAALTWDVLWLYAVRSQWKIIWIGTTLCGLCNGAVTIANNGRMPVMGYTITNGDSIWVVANESHRLLPLCDRLWLGFSIGDYLSMLGLVVALAIWAIRRFVVIPIPVVTG